MRQLSVRLEPFSEVAWPEVWAIIRDIAAAGDTFTFPRDLDETLARRLWIQSGPAHAIVAVDENGSVVGTAKMGPNQLGPGGHVATASFMVAVAARGRGVGRALACFAIDWAAQGRFRAMQFNAVVASNTAAVSLWRDLDFEIVGTVPEGFSHPQKGFVDLLVMYRRLGSSDSQSENFGR